MSTPECFLQLVQLSEFLMSYVSMATYMCVCVMFRCLRMFPIFSISSTHTDYQSSRIAVIRGTLLVPWGQLLAARVRPFQSPNQKGVVLLWVWQVGVSLRHHNSCPQEVRCIEGSHFSNCVPVGGMYNCIARCFVWRSLQCMCLCRCVGVHMCVYVCTCVHMCVCAHMCICCAHLCVCMIVCTEHVMCTCT